MGDTHDYDEATTRERLIDVELARAGWELRGPHDREYPVVGMPNEKGKGYVDYVLWGDDGKPLAVVEAKRTSADPAKGKQQAKLYADCLEAMHGRRPLIYYTNGYETLFWDDETYPPRPVLGFHKKAELESLLRRRGQAFPRGRPGRRGHRGAVLPEAGHREPAGALRVQASVGAPGHGHGDREDPDPRSRR